MTRYLLRAKLFPETKLTYCQLNPSRKTWNRTIIIYENTFVNVVYKVSAMLFKPLCEKLPFAPALHTNIFRDLLEITFNKDMFHKGGIRSKNWFCTNVTANVIAKAL